MTYRPGYSRLIPRESSVIKYLAILTKYAGNPPHTLWSRYSGSTKWEAVYRFTHGGAKRPRNADGSAK